MKISIARIISGGQTGADRGGLDAAIELGVPHGGYCPKGRIAEDGPIPEKYLLQETATTNYPDRTALNVKTADLTLVFVHAHVLDGGSKLTVNLADKFRKPYWIHSRIGASDTIAGITHSMEDVYRFCQRPIIINVAGNRESKSPGLQAYVKNVMLTVLSDVI